MKAVVVEGYHKLAVREKETPKPDGIKVIIKVSMCGICGSDYHYYYDNGDSLKGWVLGHEYGGTVIDPGARADLKAGDRVGIFGCRGCSKCALCQNGLTHLCRELGLNHGGYGEYASREPELVAKLPDEVSLVDAAMLEPLANSVHAVRKAGVYNCAKVLIIGGGIIGTTCSLAARNAGATFVALVEVNMFRAQKSLERGDCDAIFNARDEDINDKLIMTNGGRGYDFVFECSGTASGMNLAIANVYPGGTIVLIGVSSEPSLINLSPLVLKEIKLQASYGYLQADYFDAMELVQRKKIKLSQFATKYIKLDEVPQTFTDLRENIIKDTKVIIDVEGSC
jgi:2-desacetyl-2-hydroxyethyl bacteriochlorophyllide A dehydrogenase